MSSRMNARRFGIFLPKELVEFADKMAAQKAASTYSQPNRSGFIADLIIEAKRRHERKTEIKPRKPKASV